MVSELDVRKLMGIIGDGRGDPPPEGLPWSLLSDLTDDGQEDDDRAFWADYWENIFARLQVTNRTAAVIKAFPDRVA